MRMRFAVLHHTAWPGQPDHYDLLLQVAGGGSDDDRVLKAFATTKDEFPLAPSQNLVPKGERGKDDAAQPLSIQYSALSTRLRLLPDHRRVYLNYEGPVAGARGQVRRVDDGEFSLLRPLEPGLPEVYMRLAGAKLNGLFLLRHLGGGLYSFARSEAGDK